MGFLGYDKNEKLAFNFKKACGLWLMAVASVIAVATLIGGKQIINMQVFSIGYIVSFFAINQNKTLLNKLSTGSSSPLPEESSPLCGHFTLCLNGYLRRSLLRYRELAPHLAGSLNGDRTAFLPLLFRAWQVYDLSSPGVCGQHCGWLSLP